jgi:dephospho-CoA kinase
MEVIGTVGLPGSGKSEATAVARRLDVPVVVMGDVVREECRNRGLDPATHHGEVARTLREEDGPGAIARRSLPVVESELAENDTVLVDGLRSGTEVDIFEDAFGEAFLLVCIEAPDEARAQRLDLRSRDASADEGGETLSERDERELGFGMGEAMDRADLTVENAGSLDAFHDSVRTLLRKGPAALEGRTEAGGQTGGNP